MITAILAIFLFITNCKHEPLINHIPGPVDTTGNGGGNADDTTICFERDILPIIVTNCAKAGCHDAITKEENRNYTTYSGIVTKEDIKAGFPLQSKFFVELNTGQMSQAKYGNLNAAQKALIKRWITEGAKDGKNCPSKCDSSKFTYSGAIQPLLDKYCVGCHKPSSLSGNTDLSTYAGVKDAAVTKNTLMPSLKRSTSWMPLGGSKFSDCQMAQIQKWINAGAPNN
ncbi:MAG: hypothetical protein IT244_03600 [Bacteroidia bacterium]|nr:hypothetical protein [Bacteroidia bacterium]